MSERARATRDETVLRILAELGKAEPDPERLLLLRTEAREQMVDYHDDCACVRCLEPLNGAGRCDWCGQETAGVR